ncbi:MAG TPA: type II toxin-antitoxin system ParD family antitoxin [Capsulimonadaceae bacterium]
MTVSVSDELAAIIEAKVALGLYLNAEEVIRAGVLLLESDITQSQADARKSLIEGLDIAIEQSRTNHTRAVDVTEFLSRARILRDAPNSAVDIAASTRTIPATS